MAEESEIDGRTTSVNEPLDPLDMLEPGGSSEDSIFSTSRESGHDTDSEQEQIHELLRISSSTHSSYSRPGTPFPATSTTEFNSMETSVNPESTLLLGHLYPRQISRSVNVSDQKVLPYCKCARTGRDVKCHCGEEDEVFEWGWDVDKKSEACVISEDSNTVRFHMSYSSGTAAVRGNQPLVDAQYFWEIKMTSPVYGTDMMVGLGTEAVQMDTFRHTFTSMLGKDNDSVGLSYYGRIYHKGTFVSTPTGKFSQGSIVGIHADLWRSIVTFYVNKKPIPELCVGVARKALYPMVSSTAARTSMKLIKACSFRTSLQFLCCQALRQLVPRDVDALAALPLPPGLRAFLANNLSWLFRPCELCEDARPAAAAGEAQQDRKRGAEQPPARPLHTPLKKRRLHRQKRADAPRQKRAGAPRGASGLRYALRSSGRGRGGAAGTSQSPDSSSDTPLRTALRRTRPKTNTNTTSS